MPQEISLSKKYRTQHGSEVRIICIDRKGKYPGIGLVKMPNGEEGVFSYTKFGESFQGGRSGYDLIEISPKEELAPLLPWNEIPSWFNFIAMDSNCSWYAYVEKPETGETAFLVDPTNRDYYFKFPKEILFGTKGINIKWTDTVFERPKK